MRPIFLNCLHLLVLSVWLCSCQESIDERAVHEARKYTAKNCPIEIAPGVVSDSLVYDRSTRTLNYHFSVEGDADVIRIDSIEAREGLLQTVANSTNLRIYKKAGFRFRYTYRSAEEPHRVLFDCTLMPEEYE